MNEPLSIPSKVPERSLSPTAEGRTRRFPWRSALFLLGVLGVILLGLALYWSIQPRTFDVAELTETLPLRPGQTLVAGSHGVAVSIKIGETLLGKPGGFLYNDRLLPGVFLDNTPSWECGTLMALRDYTRTLRNDFSRSQSQSIENNDVKQADLRLAIDPKSWVLPEAETEYALGIEALRRYLADLNQGDVPGAQFFARADNLAAYLAVVEKRLGNFGVRLTASVSDSDLAAVIGIPGPAAQIGPQDGEPISGQTAWDQVDNVFYCARGYSWSLFHMMQAIEVDFAGVLKAKRA